MKFIKYWEERLIRRPGSGNYIRFIDGMRFLAIAPVVFQHANERLFKYGNLPELSSYEEFISFLISRGTIGVFIFFSISGFILSLPFGKECKNWSYFQYLKRRLLRIEPPFIFWMAFCAIVLLIFEKYSAHTILWHFLATITYTHQLFFQEYSIINPVAWSLEVEVQFYLLAPYISITYFSFRPKLWRRMWMLIIILSWVSLSYFFGWNLHPWKASILGQLPHFLIGILAADFFLFPVKWMKSFRFWDLMFPFFFFPFGFYLD